MAAVCSTVLLADYGMRMHNRLSVLQGNTPMSDRSSTCSSSVTDGSYFLLSQLNHPKCTDESAPTALKLAADSFSCSANSSSPFASSSPVSKTRMNVFGD